MNKGLVDPAPVEEKIMGIAISEVGPLLNEQIKAGMPLSPATLVYFFEKEAPFDTQLPDISSVQEVVRCLKEVSEDFCPKRPWKEFLPEDGWKELMLLTSEWLGLEADAFQIIQGYVGIKTNQERIKKASQLCISLKETYRILNKLNFPT